MSDTNDPFIWETISDDDDDNRRPILWYASVSIVAVVVVALLLAMGSQPVIAATLTMSDDTITTDNGAITGVTTNASGDITWDGAQEQPGSTTIKLEVKNPDGSWATIDSSNPTLSGLAGTHTYDFNNADVIGNSNWKKSDFQPSGDGASKDTTLTYRITVETTGDLDGSGSSNTVQSSQADAVLTVEDEPNSNNAGGNGGVNGQGTNNEP